MQVAVIGAGALGTATALHVADRGASVVVFEADHIAARTTGLAAGILSYGVLDHDDRCLVRATLDGLARLEEEEADDVSNAVKLLRRPGSHLLAGEGDGARVVRGMAEDLAALGIPFDVLEPPQWVRTMAELGIDVEPAGLDRVLSMPDDAWTMSTEATNLMARRARSLDVRFLVGHAVTRLMVRSGGGIKVDWRSSKDAGSRDFDAVVVAGGAWSRRLLEHCGWRLPTQAFRTHAAILHVEGADRFPIVHDDPNGFYARPEGPNHLLVGNGTRVNPVDPDSVTPDAEASFIENIAEKVPARFPTLASAGMQTAWRGVLTGTPDQRPLIGAHPDVPGLFLCVGGNGFGFMRSFGLGACAASAVLHDDVADGRWSMDSMKALDGKLIARMAPSRFWPDPPEVFPVSEGFALLPEEVARQKGDPPA